jgi:hypothetical protein
VFKNNNKIPMGKKRSQKKEEIVKGQENPVQVQEEPVKVQDAVPPAKTTLLERLKAVREAHDNAGLNHCDHPLCTNPLMAFFPKSGPRFCETHAKEYQHSCNHVYVRASDADLMPDDPLCSRVRCTRYLHKKGDAPHQEWLFRCDTCNKDVCCFCAKECHAAGHVLSDVLLCSHTCGRTEILEVREYYTVREWATNGKCKRVNRII